MLPLRDSVPSRSPALATWTLITLNVLVFLFELMLTPEALDTFLQLFGLVPARITHPAWAHSVGFPAGALLTFLSSPFLHAGWIHLAGNMWTLWIFGDNVEDQMGSFRFVVFYLDGGVGASLSQLAASPHSSLPSLGASGAIAAVMGAYFVLFPKAKILLMIPVLIFPLFFVVPAVSYLLIWFLLQFLAGTVASITPTQSGGVAWWAHIGGFATGALLVRIALLPRGRRRPRAPDEGFLEHGLY